MNGIKNFPLYSSHYPRIPYSCSLLLLHSRLLLLFLFHFYLFFCFSFPICPFSLLLFFHPFRHPSATPRLFPFYLFFLISLFLLFFPPFSLLHCYILSIPNPSLFLKNFPSFFLLFFSHLLAQLLFFIHSFLFTFIYSHLLFYLHTTTTTLPYFKYYLILPIFFSFFHFLSSYYSQFPSQFLFFPRQIFFYPNPLSSITFLFRA